MKVFIKREPRGGWHYATDDMKSEPFANYQLATQAAINAGHEIDNAGWIHKLNSWNWTHHAIDGYPTWERDDDPGHGYERGHPAFVKLAHVRGEGKIESRMLAIAWDDVANVDFYQRDWTDDGIPFVNKGETYWSGWWFATKAERDRFVAWQKERP